MRCTSSHRRWAWQPLLVLLLAAWSIGSPASAEESGTWRGRAVLIVTENKTIDVADQADHQVSLTEYDGIVFNDEGKPFLDNARYQVVDLGDTGGLANGGYKTFTAADGSQVFAKYELTEMAPPVFKGKWEFVGGTGAYKGITGRGTYEVHSIADTALWDILEGEYKVP